MTTKTAQFTPGPWAVEGDNNGYMIVGPGQCYIADICASDGLVNENDAALIAAAPAMYEALVETMRVLRSLRDNKEEWYTLVTPELLTAWDKNKTALAQAEGRG